MIVFKFSEKKQQQYISHVSLMITELFLYAGFNILQLIILCIIYNLSYAPLCGYILILQYKEIQI